MDTHAEEKGVVGLEIAVLPLEVTTKAHREKSTRLRAVEAVLSE
jgi:hypothetical protein